MRKPIETYTMAAQVATTGATGSSGAIVTRDFDFNQLVFLLAVSSMSATATLDVWIQSSADGGTTWYDTLRFPRFTASGANPAMGAASLSSMTAPAVIGASTLSSTAGGQGAPLLSNVIQAYWALGGTTPSASFNISALLTGQNGAGQ